MYRHYQRLAEPILVNAGSLPVQVDQWMPVSNWHRVDVPRQPRPPAEYPFAVLYNPAAPVTVDQWNPITFRSPRAPAPRPWQSFLPSAFDPSVIVPPSTPAGRPKVFLFMDEIATISLRMEEKDIIQLRMEEKDRIDLEMNE